jgi:hypothetical protein
MYKVFVFALPLSVILTGAEISAVDAAQVYYAQPYHDGFLSYRPDRYQGPHGRYASQTDFIRSLNGSPCGIECTRREDNRWSWAH